MINFRKVFEGDFDLLYFWLNIPHVKKFWYPNENLTFDDISEKYLKRINEDKVQQYIFSIDNLDIGFIQTYFVDDLSEFMVKGIGKGIDLYIGDKNYLYKGYGFTIIREFIAKFVFSDKSVEYVVIDPIVRNTGAIKAYKKAGFEHTNTAYNKYEKEDSHYMVMTRDKFFCNY